MFFHKDNWAYIKFNKDYKISVIFNKKFNDQRVGLYHIFKYISRLIYTLNILSH